ncbi:hypothetical protein KL929_002653 [Ogataea haglerorum]|nr:hypothetical protein KL948_004077 [Ogataea haglerorum]KAG7796947.1 hypothetical protein KL929_002653 [Ogataea haglerorum]KAG7801388.1 hypothetical protein KL944_003120 [Ogataea haglerorum]
MNNSIGRLEKEIEESVPYFASDETSSVRKEAPELSAPPREVKPWVHFVAGGLGGMCGAVFTSPFDVVKTRLQSSVFRDAYKSGLRNGGMLSGAALHFKETLIILRNVYTVEGPRALFKGLGPNLVGVIPARSINFFTYGYSKDLIKNSVAFKGEESSLVHLLAGISAGFVTSTATNPIWLVKTRLQLDRATTKAYKNSFDCLVKIHAPMGAVRADEGGYPPPVGAVAARGQETERDDGLVCAVRVCRCGQVRGQSDHVSARGGQNSAQTGAVARRQAKIHRSDPVLQVGHQRGGSGVDVRRPDAAPDADGAQQHDYVRHLGAVYERFV